MTEIEEINDELEQVKDSDVIYADDDYEVTMKFVDESLDKEEDVEW